MPESILSTDLVQSPEEGSLCCNLCGRMNDQRLPPGSLPPDIAALLEAKTYVADDLTQVCANCVELLSRARAQIESHPIVFEQTDHV